MRVTKTAILALGASAICSGCAQRSSHSGSDSSAAESEQEAIVEMLPDTTFDSAKIIKYTIEQPDSASGELSSLADLYASAPGAFTFRKGPLRDADFGGRIKGVPSNIETEWTFETDEDMRETSVGRWGGGTGWTGEPVIVEWPDSLQKEIRKAPGTLAAFGPREVIFGSLASKVYFVNYDTGLASREPIDVSNPIKGSVSLDPTLNGNLYVGHGVPAVRPFGAVVIDLFANRITDTMAEDPKAPRRWGAYDSSAIRVGQFLFRPGENGRIYKYFVSPGEIRLHSAVGYTVEGVGPGIEASMAVYRNYGYTADNRGNLICWNLNTIRPVWLYNTGDDTDATPVIRIEEGKPYVYTASEIDLQGSGTARFAKLDALTGKPVWEQRIAGRRADVGGKHFDGGFYATPLPGSGNCSNLIIANCVLNTERQNGETIAFDTRDGKIVWRTPLRYYAWSSPVAFLNEKNEMYAVTFDCIGNVYIIEAATGKILFRENVGANFESSPAVRGDRLVVGSRGKTVMRFRIK